MDPSTWPMWAKVLAGWGPLGVWAGIMTWAYFRSEKRHEKAQSEQARRFADVVATMTKDSRVREDKIHVEHRTDFVAQGVLFAKEISETEARHHEQENELVDRLLSAGEKHGDITRGLAEKLATLAESMKRHGKPGGDDGPTT